jgi:NADH-quinone oxidoreductase subunit N
VTPEPFVAPAIAWSALSPILLVFGVAVVGVLVEAFVPDRLRATVHVPLAVGGLAAAFVAVCLLAGTEELVAAGAIVVDGPALFLQGVLALLGICSILLLAERKLDSSGGSVVADAAIVPGSTGDRVATASRATQTEVYPLAMFALGGMLLFPAANDLLIMFIALEALSLPLYLMAGLARRRRLLSQEAAMKYFLLGAFSSAFFLYGLALLYGFSGTVRLGGIFEATQTAGANDALLLLGLALLSVGLLFKVGAAPFHSWTPDVYQGSPTPVTALMAAGTKVAAFGAVLRVFYVAFETMRWDWRPMMWGVAILTMVVGSVFAVTQRDVKRMLAYSAVAHTGFLLTGVIALTPSGISGSLFYLAAYGFTTLGSFAIVSMVRGPQGEATDLAQWQGLGRQSPVVAGIFALFLFALAGIPLTSGFTSKFAVFAAAIEGGAAPLVVVGVVTSAIAAFFYARVVVMMFFQDPVADSATVAVPSGYTAVAIAVGVAVTVVLGVLPQPLLSLAGDASVFLR